MVAVGRVAIGTALFVRPQVMQAVTGGSRLGRRAQALARMTGVRDLAIGAGALARASHPETLMVLAAVGAVADAGDLVASVVAASRLEGPTRARWLAQAGVAGLSAAATAALLAAAIRTRD